MLGFCLLHHDIHKTFHHLQVDFQETLPLYPQPVLFTQSTTSLIICKDVQVRYCSLYPLCRLVRKARQQNMQRKIGHDARKAQATNDAKAHDILGRIVVGEQVGSVNLRQVAHGVDKGQRDAFNFVGCRGERGRRVRQGERVGDPEAAGHDDHEDVARGRVVDGADNDGADHCEGHPYFVLV